MYPCYQQTIKAKLCQTYLLQVAQNVATITGPAIVTGKDIKVKIEMYSELKIWEKFFYKFDSNKNQQVFDNPLICGEIKREIKNSRKDPNMYVEDLMKWLCTVYSFLLGTVIVKVVLTGKDSPCARSKCCAEFRIEDDQIKVKSIKF